MRPPASRLIDDPLWRHRGNPDYSEHGPAGFRPSVPLETADILVTGSSHVYGTNLQPGLTWPSILVKQGRRLFDASMGAWSMMQFALVAEHYLRPSHRLLLVPLYVGFDVYATLKHSQETKSPLAERMMDGLPEAPQPSWDGRNARDAFIQERIEGGATFLAALESAREARLPDTFSIRFEDADLWMEPELRVATMDVAHPYIRASLTLAMRYLGHIRSLCDVHRTRLGLVVLPTREYVVARAASVSEGPLEQVVAVEDALVRRIMAEASPIVDMVHDMTPTYVSRFREGVFRQADRAPLDGHPSAQGAAIIAETMDPLIQRWTADA